MKNSTLLHIPHASTVIPGNYLASFRQAILPHEIEVMTDWFCDELLDCGRDRIVFPISRLVCDVERFRDDKQEIMADIGMGVTYRCTSTLEHLRSTMILITKNLKGLLKKSSAPLYIVLSLIAIHFTRLHCRMNYARRKAAPIFVLGHRIIIRLQKSSIK